MLSPYEILHKTPPSYQHLRVFGSTYFLWQVPTCPSKLHPNAPQCIFVGYSPHHKGYKCFNYVTNKIIISCHVSFHETLPNSTTLSTPPSTISTSTPIPPLLLPPASASTNTPQPNIVFFSSRYLYINSPSISQPLSPPNNPPSSNPHPPTVKHHPMLTRLQTGHTKPKLIFNLEHSLLHDTTPTTFAQANQTPAWRLPMLDEIQALRQKHSWNLVVPPANQPILGSKWIFKLKRNSDGTIIHHKARLIAQGFNQTPGLDYVETFSPVATLPTIRIFITTALHRNWIIQQLDVYNAFLHGTLQEKLYMTQPKSFEDPAQPHVVCLLHKAIYGLKQAPRQWNSALAGFLKSLGFTSSSPDTSLLPAQHTVYVLFYVDDILVTGSSLQCIQDIINSLSQRFNTKLIEEPSTFLGIQTVHSSNQYFLHWSSCISDILQHASMSTCSPVSTPTAPPTSKPPQP